VHLKTLTLRGFKSFASATTLRFEPGITAVVGPNGSGKSNVVDALAWVMGEQGAKSLRGGKMEDVIFAGTAGGSAGAGRGALGRAEVVLTIDNSDGALPIEYAEVSITRTMFRLGGSDYAINGRPCRLLDVQELLADSGIGREMHVIVGQGRLDAVLSAGPVERRGFLEEAAGVVKHRRRKEKALRKLDAMAANLARVADLTAEIGRQLKPLGRQAETARRAQAVQADLRDARARLLADDLVSARVAAASAAADLDRALADRAGLDDQLAQARQEQTDAEHASAAGSAAVTEAAERWYAWSGLGERVRGTAVLAADRAAATGPPSAPAGPDPDALDSQAAGVRADEDALRGDVATAAAARQQAAAARQQAEVELAAAERSLADLRREAARRRDRIATLAAERAAAASRVASGEAEADRLDSARDAARDRARAAEREQTLVETDVAGMDAGEQGLDAEYEAAATEVDRLALRTAGLAAAEHATDRERAALGARVEALRLSLDIRDGAAALLGRTGGPPAAGVTGSLVDSLTVAPGAERAVAAALGRFAEAVVVGGPGDLVSAVRMLRDRDWGRAALVVGGSDGEPVAVIPEVGCPPALRPAVAALLRGVVVVADLDEAALVVAADPTATAVTREGDVLTATSAAGGSVAAPSGLEVRAAVEQAESTLAEVDHAAQRHRFELAAVRGAHAQAAERAEALLDRLHESDARMAAVAERLGQLTQTVRSAHAEADRLGHQAAGVRAATAAAAERCDGLRQRLDDARAEELAAPTTLFDETDPRANPDDRAAAAAALEAARTAEVEARLVERSTQERLAAIAGRAESLAAAAATRRRDLADAAHRAARAERRRSVAAAVAAACSLLVTEIGSAAEAARAEREAVQAGQQRATVELRSFRTRVRELTDADTAAAGRATAAEVTAAARGADAERLAARVGEEGLGDPDVLVAEYGPDVPVPTTAAAGPADASPAEAGPAEAGPAGAESGEPVPYVRTEQLQRRRRAERALAELGRVNPLALEEFAALTERHSFLTEQLRDLRTSRDDLLGVVADVDARVQQVFAEAFADTAREFEGVFARLFPGGEGRLVLTDPDDMLGSGIEIEARPPGKKVRRLSLLSGGERSLVAVALLVSIFKARPSPFYVLDEVEAALDDTNLGRLLSIYEELRESSQLLVVTHQKRTMEIADALYGVAMRGDGVTTVISQRVRERTPA